MRMSTKVLVKRRLESQSGELLSDVDDPARYVAVVGDVDVITTTTEIVEDAIEETEERYEPVPDDEYLGQWRVRIWLRDREI